jgi:hypothetical protein
MIAAAITQPPIALRMKSCQPIRPSNVRNLRLNDSTLYAEDVDTSGGQPGLMERVELQKLPGKVEHLVIPDML